ncbi:hypothetical protein K8I61_14070 [bacterium]|nr:hypothetical protein [bacterium]
MRKLIVFAVAIGVFTASFAFAQVYDKGGGIFQMAGKLSKDYEAYPDKKPDGKIGRLYAVPHGKDENQEDVDKKFYVTEDTKITLKKGGTATVKDLVKDTIVLFTYKKDSQANLIVREVEIQ